ncbi:unnamed protein product [Linum tenue]|uniref:Dienelactone hydrolase domain-containing protein n=1 Tax=Linum tenue TaxID=586396 RepID=A0AAV0P7B8_9ROSI|nr:unnamed protein product [Linum tenue]
MCLFASLLLHKQYKGFEDAKAVIESLKNKGVSAIGAAGFCWGGMISDIYVVLISLFFFAKVVVELAHINAGVLLHPSFVTVDDIKEVKAPLAVLGAEFDHLSPPALVKQFEEVLATKPEFDGFVKIFPGVAHGWTVRVQS